MIFPQVFIYSLLLLFSFFSYIYLSTFYSIFFTTIVFIFLSLLYQSIAYKKLIITSLFFLWHYYELPLHLKKHILISTGKKFTGMVVDKKDLEKSYLYKIDLYSFKTNLIHQNINAQITVTSKQNITAGSFVYIPSIYIIEKHNSINQLLKNPLNLSSHAFGISHCITIQPNYQYKKIYTIISFLYNLRDSFYRHFKSHFAHEHKFFFDTIFLGKSNSNKKYRNLFFSWGIGHYLARSGLHIQICIQTILSCLLFLGFSYISSILIQLCFLFIFYFLTFSSISFFRAFLMFFLMILCKLLKIPTSTLHLISVATIITFFTYPFCFLQLSTQLTFFITYILALINYLKKSSKKQS